MSVPFQSPDRFREECGVVGVASIPEAANLAYLSLYAMQHRGQESCGIVARNSDEMHQHRGMGLVASNFSDNELRKLPGRIRHWARALLDGR